MNLNQFTKIFCLVSGGHDSTYLYEKLKKSYGDKVYPVNCYNPFETSETLTKISKDTNYIQVKPNERYKYGEILKKSFLKLPQARELRKNKKYEKKIFPCCKIIKHKAFLADPLFKEPNTVVISGIKAGDGKIRGWFLKDLRNPPEKHNYASDPKKGFFHRHKGGQLYCYPFRDYFWRELPGICIRKLKKKYPTLDHSGCRICPVVVLFNLTKAPNYVTSVRYADKLGVLDYIPVSNFF